MLIAMFPNTLKSQSKNIAISIREFLTHQGAQVVVEDSECVNISAPALSNVDPNSVDFIISLGGDGTILRLVHKHPELKAPILGINLGSLGFMADVPTSDIYPALQDLIDGAYHVQDRIMMEGETISGEKCFAINEISIHRASNPSLIDLAIHVDGDYLNTFSADGIIIATPSGSTAYSLAAGGPIVAPDLEAFIITPISPHTISNRPIVLMPKADIQVQYLSEHAPVEVSFDGMANYPLRTGDVFHIRRSSRMFRLVCLRRHNYFSVLRTKLGWTGKLRA